MTPNEKRIAELMAQLGCSRAEAEDIILYDSEVEEGKSTEYDLTPEQQENVKEMNRKTEHKKGAKRNRKPNDLKEAIVAELADFLKEDAQSQVYEDVTITNVNRMVAFTVNGKKFELTLVEKRPAKTT